MMKNESNVREEFYQLHSELETHRDIGKYFGLNVFGDSTYEKVICNMGSLAKSAGDFTARQINDYIYDYAISKEKMFDERRRQVA